MYRALLIGVFAVGCAANTNSTGDDRDASLRDGGDSDKSDASFRGPCVGDAPHGCFQLSADSPSGCPVHAPELPDGVPPSDQWDLCNGLSIFLSGQTCIWNGPTNHSASCLCDGGLHWTCTYR
jgi:hypothetical protein